MHINRIIILLLSLLWIQSSCSPSASAQCNGRYEQNIFQVSKATVTYSDTFGLQMDIYQPQGDTAMGRPLVILAHGGSFIQGDRTNDPAVTELCTRLARKGYVTASIDYRLTTTNNMLDSVLATNAVTKAISDGKAAIRFFIKDKQTNNNYKIDTTKIFIGGNSAGAVLYMHVAYVGSTAEAPAGLQAAMNNNGGFEGNSGNAGYSYSIKGVINMAGALNAASLISAGDPRAVNFQGDQDNVVPYNCGRPLMGYCPVTLCGLGSMEPVFTANNIYHISKIFPGDQHVPWNSDSTKFNTVDSITTAFLLSQVCKWPASVGTTEQLTSDIYPNPASDIVFIRTTRKIASLDVYDMTGKKVPVHIRPTNDGAFINTQHFAKGIYYIRMSLDDNGRDVQINKKLSVE